MIVVNIRGGVGNQLFQYCYAKKEANRLKTELKLDIQYLVNCPKGWTKHEDELVNFEGINEERIIGNPNLKVVTENPDHQFRNYNIIDNTFIDGYWQNEQFCEGIDIKFKPEIENNIKGLCGVIKKENSICLHARRGDYLVGGYFVDLSNTEYYQKAIEIILKEVENPKFYIFSNDKIWVKNYFTFIKQEKYYMENSTIEDLYLMSLCKHNITANSSYSWWGAKLNKNPNKIIIQPNKWTSKRDISNLKLKDSIIL